MSAGTKVTIAIVVLFAALLGVYYGFGGPGSGAAPDELPPADEQQADQETSGDLPLTAPEPDLADPTQGVLSASVDQAMRAEPPYPEQDFGVLASDRPVAIPATRARPPDDAWVLGPTPAYPPPAAPPAGPRAQFADYTVEEGDSMWTIAEAWLDDPSRWGLIAEANPAIDPDRLRVGQRIRIPTGTPAAGPLLNAPATLSAVDRPPAGAVRTVTYYTVRSGDTLSRIAQLQYQNAALWRAVYDANRTTIGVNPNRLEVGMRLRIPPA